jgi:hypothetical protein
MIFTFKKLHPSDAVSRVGRAHVPLESLIAKCAVCTNVAPACTFKLLLSKRWRYSLSDSAILEAGMFAAAVSASGMLFLASLFARLFF